VVNGAPAAVLDAVALGGMCAAGPPRRRMFADAPAAQRELDLRVRSAPRSAT